MKKLISIILLSALLCLTACQNAQQPSQAASSGPQGTEAAEPTEPEVDKLDEMVAKMSVEEKVGQMFFVRCPDTEAARTAAKYHLGGYILFGRDFEDLTADQVSENIKSYQDASDIPMLIGCNLFELDGTSPAGVKSRLTPEEKRAMVAERVGEKTADEVMAEFGKAYPEMDVSYAGATDIRFRIPQLLFMEKRYEMAKAPVWCYMFTYESLFMGGVLPGHGGELPFMFGNADHNVAMFREGVSGRLMAEMERSWLSFAYTGNPNGSHIAKWEAWDPERRACMNLGCTTVLKHGHDERLLQLLKDKEIGEIKI